MSLKSILALAFTATGMFATSARAQTSTWTINPKHTQADFLVRHLAFSTARGTISGAKGSVVLDEKDITKSKVEATLATATINTQNVQRDADLKSPNFFDVEKNPTMTFKSTSITNTDGKLKMTGDLTLNGITKSMTLDVDGPVPSQKGQDDKMVSGFSAGGTIKRSDFHFGQKSQYSSLIGDEVKFTLNVEIDKQ